LTFPLPINQQHLVMGAAAGRPALVDQTVDRVKYTLGARFENVGADAPVMNG
jgi:hypothetical protein